MGGQYIEPMTLGSAARRPSPLRARIARWLPRLPRQCELCRQWGSQPLCSACVARFAPIRARCPCCALPTAEARVCGECLRRPPAFDEAVAAVDYGFPWDGLISRFKFRDQPELASCLARRIVAAIGQAQADLIVPVPLAAHRLRERGYNQAWELARRIADLSAIPADATVLVRADDAAHQVGASRAARERNLQHGLWADPTSVSRITGRRVAVVDDVMTTGATAEAAARALKLAGADRVLIWVLARTPSTA
jgi:ComF family protein